MTILPQSAEWHITTLSTFVVLSDICHRTDLLLWSMPLLHLVQVKSLAHGIADYNINRLQRIQNCAARLVIYNGKYRHVKVILQKLHWLSVKQDIHF